VIELNRLTPQAVSLDPYRWAFVDGLFSANDCAELVKTFPRDHFKTVEGYDGEKGYYYESRSLISMGANAPTHCQSLSSAWKNLAEDLLSVEYRESMSRLSGVDLRELSIEANVFHYGRSAWLGPHVDLPDKLVTHILYFNDAWDPEDGGCLTILRSRDMDSPVKIVPPIVGNSVVIVRADNSWHAVSRVRERCRSSRRSVALTFYRPGSLSTMWPEGDVTPLHNYTGERSALSRFVRRSWHQMIR